MFTIGIFSSFKSSFTLLTTDPHATQNFTRTSGPQMFSKIGDIENFVKFAEKLRLRLFLIKLQTESETSLRKKLRHEFFLVSFAKIFKTNFFTDPLRTSRVASFLTQPSYEAPSGIQAELDNAQR